MPSEQKIKFFPEKRQSLDLEKDVNQWLKEYPCEVISHCHTYSVDSVGTGSYKVSIVYREISK